MTDDGGSWMMMQYRVMLVGYISDDDCLESKIELISLVTWIIYDVWSALLMSKMDYSYDATLDSIRHQR